MSQLPEYREFPRMAVDCSLSWHGNEAGSMQTGFARNISANGLLFVARERPAIGDRMEITVNPGVLSIPALTALVEVVRVAESAAHGVAGAPFANPCFEVGARIVSMR